MKEVDVGYISNFSRALLLGGLPIYIKVQKPEPFNFVVTLPTARTIITDNDHNKFGALISADPTALGADIGINSSTRLQLFLSILRYSNNPIASIILRYLHLYISSFEYVDDSLTVGGNTITDEVFEHICECWAIASGYRAFDKKSMPAPDSEEEIEALRKQRKHEQKIRELRNKNKSNVDPIADDLFKMIPVIANAFNYKIDEVYDLNIFAINHLYLLGIKLAYDRLSVAVHATGNVDKKSKYKFLLIE